MFLFEEKMPATKTLEVTSVDGVPGVAMDGLPTLVYWSISGLAQAPRYALELSGVDYVDVRIADREAWVAKKPTLEVPFANLPYLLDSKEKLAQSGAILRYVASDLSGGKLLSGDAALLNVALDQAKDFDGSITGPCYRDPEGMIETYFKGGGLKEALKQWAAFLGDRPFLAGDAVTIADCKFYETLRKIKIICTEFDTNKDDPFYGVDAITAYANRFEAIPAIAAYHASPAFKPRPLNGFSAKFR